MTANATDRLVDLRRAPLSALRAIDVRSRRRDSWADEVAIHGHGRAHHAMIGPWVARVGRPAAAVPRDPEPGSASADARSTTAIAVGGSR